MDHQPPRKFPFLTARWANIVIVTYAVEPGQIQEFVPPGCTLDLRDGRAFVSLVGLEFVDTRVLGISWPGYRDFPEINLRIYVQHKGQRGVCFLREFVPQRLVATLARLFYNEPYVGAAVSCEMRKDDASISVEYRLAAGESIHFIRAVGEKPAILPLESSIEHFFKEHDWGFGASRGGKLLRYPVEHPVWEIWPIRSFDINWNWAKAYGDRWAFLDKREPDSVIFARGSEVSVYPKKAGRVSRESPVMLFDGVCNLCNASVDFVLAHEADDCLRFAPLQSEFARNALRSCGLNADDLSGVVLIEDGRCYSRSIAAARIALYLRWPYRLLALFMVMPEPVRDAVYDFIARWRYRWFGKSECRVPAPELRGRFMG